MCYDALEQRFPHSATRITTATDKDRQSVFRVFSDISIEVDIDISLCEYVERRVGRTEPSKTGVVIIFFFTCGKEGHLPYNVYSCQCENELLASKFIVTTINSDPVISVSFQRQFPDECSTEIFASRMRNKNVLSDGQITADTDMVLKFFRHNNWEHSSCLPQMKFLFLL